MAEMTNKREFNIRLHKLQDQSGSVKAMLSASFGGAVRVDGFRLVDGQYGLFVGCPSRQDKTGKWRDTVTWGSEEIKDQFTAAVLSEWEKLNK